MPDIIRSSLPAASLRQLSSNPLGRRICRHPPNHTIRRRRCRRTRKPYSSRKESVGTTNRSIDAMPSSMIGRKVVQPCDGPPLLRAMYFATLVWPTSMPSLSSSPWMRGAPRAGWPGSCPGSADGSPAGRSVSRRAVWISNARTIETPATGANERRSQSDDGRKQTHDSRRSTLICCRRTRISASSRALERNKLVSAVHSSMRTSTIGHEHHPIRPR